GVAGAGRPPGAAGRPPAPCSAGAAQEGNEVTGCAAGVALQAIEVGALWGSREQVQRLSWLVYRNHLPSEGPALDLRQQFCHPPGCPDRGVAGKATPRRHSRKEGRFRCATCGKTFALTRGTPDYRRHTPADLVT